MTTPQPPETTPGLRARKKQRTAEAIRHAATELFRAQGYEATTVEQIAEMAEVSPSTFFRYFRTKESVLLRTSEGAEVVRRGLAAEHGDEPLWTTLSRVMVEGLPSLIDVPREEVERIRIAYSTPSVRGAIAAAMAEMQQEIAETLRARLGTGEAAELRAQVMASALCGAIELTQAATVAGKVTGNPLELLREALEMYGHGLDRVTSSVRPRER